MKYQCFIYLFYFYKFNFFFKKDNIEHKIVIYNLAIRRWYGVILYSPIS